MLENHLNTFREKYISKNVMQYSDELVYKTRSGFAKIAAQGANRLIEQLNLPLVAIATSLLAGDSFIVKSNEIEL